MKKRLQHTAPRLRSGTATVELAVLLPFLLLGFVMALDFARVFYFSVTVENVARKGAYYGSQNPTNAVDTAGIQAAAQTDGSNLNLANLQVTSSTDSMTSPSTVTVTASYPFQAITRYPWSGGQTTISRTVQMSVTPWTPN